MSRALLWVLWILHVCIPICHAEAVDIYQKQSLVLVQSGDAVTLHCMLAEQLKNEDVFWYKQPLGQMPQAVGIKSLFIEAIFSPLFQNSGIKLERTANSISLTIPSTTKHDEGIYYCGISLMKMSSFSHGTFLAVIDHQQPNISVLQSPALQSVPPGQWVNLQCRVLSEIRSAELRVLWFRSSAGSFPQIIYTHHNSSSRQCEIISSNLSCVYNFSTNIHNAATYYCAVETCGRVIIGNGTTVAMEINPSLLVGIGIALGLSILWNIALCCFCVRWTNCNEQCKVFTQAQGKSRQDLTNIERLQFQEHGHDFELNYAALNFQENKTKRTRKKRGCPQNSVYSEVRVTSHT